MTKCPGTPPAPGRKPRTRWLIRVPNTFGRRLERLAQLSGRATRWLDAEEQRTWRALIAVVQKLPAALDSRLLRTAGLSPVIGAAPDAPTADRTP